jgi:hypothetical protein
MIYEQVDADDEEAMEEDQNRYANRRKHAPRLRPHPGKRPRH